MILYDAFALTISFDHKNEFNQSPILYRKAASRADLKKNMPNPIGLKTDMNG
jgi:hypothetical protein